MDNSGILDNEFSPRTTSLVVDEVAKNFLGETAKWGRFLAILGFVGVGLFVLLAFVMLFMGTAFIDVPGTENNSMGILFGGFGAVIYLLLAVLYFFPARYLYRFSEKTKQAIATNDTPALTEALGNLKSLYKFFGILAAIFVGFYALGLLLTVVGGGLAAFG